MRLGFASLAVAFACVSTANAARISELLPDPGGPSFADPSMQDVELTGDPNAAFDLWLVSIESDPGNSQGSVDRVSNVTGSFDSAGFAVVTILDLENPSFTLVLAEGFTGSTGTDVDTQNNGTADDLSAFVGVLDAIGVLEDGGDPGYGAAFGGEDMTPTGTDPELVFRDGVTGDWYSVLSNGTVFDLDGNVVPNAAFNLDPTATTFGVVNPTTIPEPGAVLLTVMGAAFACAARVRIQFC